jgi:predicted Zn finger-like uncharacterized protein
MRLICPNCGAQYEVDAGMIPDEGRDVQCSACGHTWFQHPEGVEAPHAEADAAATAAGPSAEAPPDEAPAAMAEERAAEEEASAYAAGSEVGGDADWPEEPEADKAEAAPPADEIHDEGTAEGEPPPAGAAEERTPDEHIETVAAAAAATAAARPSERLDEDSLRVLREEAEREATARRAEQAQALETQPELGLSEAGERSAKSFQADEDEEDAALPGSRGDMLPDIDQINSTLRPASEHAEAMEVADPMMVEAQHRSGFRWGFTLMIVVAALLVIAYVFAPQIAQQSPAVEPAVASYVDMVNGLRDQVEGFLTRTTESLSGMSDEDGGE